MNASTLIELSLNEYQRSLHTYKDRHHECHALGLVGELAEVQEELKKDLKWLSIDRDVIRDVLIAAGRVADMVKKATAHGVPLDREKLKKELGDVLWYITAVASDNALTLEEIAQANVAKLRARYPEGFVKGGGVRNEVLVPQKPPADAKEWTCPSCSGDVLWCACGPSAAVYEPAPVPTPSQVREFDLLEKSDAIYRTGDVSLAGGVPTVLKRLVVGDIGQINKAVSSTVGNVRPNVVSVNLRTEPASDLSAQPCGCDKGAGWVCTQHTSRELPSHAVHFGCGCSETTLNGIMTRRYCPNGECRKLAR